MTRLGLSFDQKTLDDRKALDWLAEATLFGFVWRVFDTLHQGSATTFKPNWHIEAMCYELEEAMAGRNPRLVITVPPRHLKSIVTAVAWPAYLLAKDPSAEILVASYGQELARQHSDDFRRVLDAPWYRRLFPRTQIASPGSRGEDMRTTRGGMRKGVSTGGAGTGFGGQTLIVDDLLKAADAHSETEREKAKTYLDESLLTRFNDPRTGVVVMIQQRLHEDDPAGYLLAKGVYRHLNLPAIAEERELIRIGPGITHERQRGGLLFPQVFTQEVLDLRRREMGTAAFNCQYQQNPIAPDGSALRWEWFGIYEEPPPRSRLQFVAQSWDTAMSANPGADFSVCTTWGFLDDKWYLLDVFRKRLDMPDLRAAVLRLAKTWNADNILIEDASSGTPLLQELRHMKLFRFVPIKPRSDEDKEVRFGYAGVHIEAGKIVLPAQAAWLADFKRELMGFPRSAKFDQVDSVSQFINWACNGGPNRHFGGEWQRRERIVSSQEQRDAERAKVGLPPDPRARR